MMTEAQAVNETPADADALAQTMPAQAKQTQPKQTQEKQTAGAYFDEHGRCIPDGIKGDHHAKTRRYFLCEQPAIDYADIHARLVQHLHIEAAISVAEFSQRAEKILADLAADPLTSNILNGVRVPFMLAKPSFVDIGASLEEDFIPAVQASFEQHFPGRDFTNHHKGGLAGKFSIAAGSRHEQLLGKLQSELVVGYYFPCLSEFSVPAAVEQAARLPEKFMLAGGYDTAAALVAAPDLLLRTSGYPPVLWFAALKAEKDTVGYHFEAYGYNLTFNRRVHFNKAAESWNSGLVVIG